MVAMWHNPKCRDEKCETRKMRETQNGDQAVVNSRFSALAASCSGYQANVPGSKGHDDGGSDVKGTTGASLLLRCHGFPYKLFPHFPPLYVSNFPPLQFCVAFSCLASSCPAFSAPP